MILVHAADLHLGSPLGGLGEHADLPVRRIRQAPMRAFERLADECERLQAELLVIAGDLFDVDADLATMREAAQVLERICRAGTRVVTIRGNHDAQSRMQRRLPAIDGLHQLPVDAAATVVFEELGVAVHGRGFDTPRVLDAIVTEYPAAVPGLLNVGVLHTSLAGAPGHDPYAPCTLDDLIALGYDYWALGHVHVRQVLHDAPWIVYAGNTQGRDIGETGARGATIVEFAEGAVTATPYHVDLDDVRWSRLPVELDADETAQELLERMSRLLAELVQREPDNVHIVRVEVGGRGRAHDELAAEPAAWRSRLHDAAYHVSTDALYLEQVRFRTAPQLPDASTLLVREDAIGDIARVLLGDDVEPTPIDGDAFSGLERKLAPLQDGVSDELLAPVTVEELRTAREALVGRLLVAHADAAGGSER